MSSLKKCSRLKTLQRSDPGKILSLVMSLVDDSCADLQIKLNAYLCEECEADIVYMMIVHVERLEVFVDVIGTHKLPRKLQLNITEKINEMLDASTEIVNLINKLDPVLLATLKFYISTEDPKKRVVMIPVLDKPFSIIVCLVAPKMFENQVSILVHECALFTWPTLKKSVAFEYECLLKQRCQMLLRVTRRLMTQLSCLDKLLDVAMEQAKQLTNSEYCNLMLIDPDRMELIRNKEGGCERRFSLNKGITGKVLSTGKLINVNDVTDHPSFDEEIDSLQDINCRNLLCFPIREQSGIIGVGQLINKTTGPHFDALDEEMALAFSIYCGACLIHSVIYQKMEEAHIRNALANELVIYHVKVSDEEVSRMVECTGFHNHPHLHSLHFNPRAIPLRELPCYVYRMFHDLGFDRRFNLKKEKLMRFILCVKKGYRDVPHHNWMHAFVVTQWAYASIINYRLIANGYFTDLQGLMYLLASLMHDLDHRGTTTSYHIQGKISLAAIYCSEGSVMERYHLAHALCILNTEGCDILECLPRRDYDRALIHLRDFILATDLSNYFKNMNDYEAIAIDFHRGNLVHANALSCLIMNCADLSDQLKDWSSVKKSAASVLAEFFKQSEEDKQRGELPSIMLEKNKCFIPDLQIEFLETVCIPLFQIVAKMIRKVEPCIKILEGHIERWDGSKPVFAEVPVTAGLSVLLSPELDTLIDLNIQEKELERKRLEAEAEAEGAAQQQ